MTDRLALDRRLVNLLTACRLYLDQTDRGILKLYGESSCELSDWREFRHVLYNENWGYRLMEEVRNHIQHKGLPVHHIAQDMAEVEGKIEGYSQYVIIPEAETAIFAEDPKFKKTVLAELQKKGKTIDLRGPARDYVSCLVRLHVKVRSILAEKNQKDRSVFEAAASEFSTIREQLIRCPSVIAVNDDGTSMEEIALMTATLDYYDFLKKRNRAEPIFATACASNSIQEKLMHSS